MKLPVICRLFRLAVTAPVIEGDFGMDVPPERVGDATFQEGIA
jgi:hypothetical protein